MRKHRRTEPTWMLYVGVTCLIGAVVLLMFVPTNSLGF